MPAAENRAEENTSSDVNEEDLLQPDSDNHHREIITDDNAGKVENGEEEADDGNKEESDGDVAEINDVIDEDVVDDDDDDDDDDDVEEHNMMGDFNGEENGGQLSSDDEDENKEEFTLVRLAEIRKEVQCPICLGIIRKTRTVMECLHRFCRECIDKSMRLGNNECPACRTHCASRRSLRDDPIFDAIIAAIYPDIDQYEEEEMSFQEDEIARNKQIQAEIAETWERQIQAAIAETAQRQTEALGTKRKKAPKPTNRRRRNYRSEDEEETNGHDGGNDSSSEDERCTEVKSKRSKRWRGQPSAAGTSGNGGGNEHNQEVRVVAPVGLVGTSEMLAWGRGGIRSNTRYGSGAGAHGKYSRNRLGKLGDHLRKLQENESELEIQVVLISLDQQKPSALQHSFLSSRPALSVRQLCQFIAVQTSLPPEKVEILAAKGPSSKLSSYSPVQGQLSSSCALDSCKDDLQVLDSEETLAGLRAACNFSQGQLMLAYRQKASA